MKKIFSILLLFVFLLTACKKTQNAKIISPTESSLKEIDRNGCIISDIPDELSFDPFYKKYCNADGIPVISSEEVDDLALQQAYYILMNMLVAVPDIHQELVSKGIYFGVIGKNERLTSIPEYAHMDSDYWDQRARGLGGGTESSITTSAEENLLCLENDRYYGENIAIHEFAHTISILGLGSNFDSLLLEFTEIYETALEEGLWENTYAGSNMQEYWAEGVQSYFNANIQSVLGDGVHNHVNTREELAEYDPVLYDFISDIFNDHEWTPTCPNEE
ncbi:MAG: hypothetical protein HN390_06790 [Anaerolineae bacterium]|jgi:hypothetical protein|nr:hypothetical protein [Anaerolineae bacterium]MBT7189833.1 hypothetical protein [Anaerolineae bacterium]MBT7988880.1 hypothetical protein [Anaerolineae bacterium]